MSEVVPLPKRQLMTVSVSLGSFQQHVDVIAEFARLRCSAYVCCVNAHMTVEARDPSFASIVANADLATADGMPVRYALNLFHRTKQERVAGNDLLPALLQRAAQDGSKVYLYGGKGSTQRAIIERAGREFPQLVFAGGHTPPFAPIDTMDPEVEAARINATQANMIFVSLGCPKQEKWMAMMKGRVPGVMIGLGGAFPLYAGLETRAPHWMRSLALEWMYRLAIEPRRLWKRYLITNSIFLFLFLKEWIRRWGRPSRRMGGE